MLAAHNTAPRTKKPACACHRHINSPPPPLPQTRAIQQQPNPRPNLLISPFLSFTTTLEHRIATAPKPLVKPPPHATRGTRHAPHKVENAAKPRSHSSQQANESQTTRQRCAAHAISQSRDHHGPLSEPSAPRAAYQAPVRTNERTNERTNKQTNDGPRGCQKP